MANRIMFVSLGCLFTLGACAQRNTNTGEPENLEPRKLYSFETCGSLEAYAKKHTQAYLEQFYNADYNKYYYYGDPLGGFAEDGFGTTGASGISGGDEALGDSDSGTDGGVQNDGQTPPSNDNSGKNFSETNVQEAGVDEPDIVKTDGERILALAQGKLHYISIATDGAPTYEGALNLEAYSGQIFLAGDEVFLVEHRNNYYYDHGEPGFVEDGFEGSSTGTGGEDLNQLPVRRWWWGKWQSQYSKW